MKITILDGYVDEPSCLGVPPYISPYPRSAAGAALSEGASVEYLTIDQVRTGRKLPAADLLVVIGGTAVPGKYLRGAPASKREIIEIGKRTNSPRMLGGPIASYFADDELRQSFDHIVSRDVEAAVYEFVRSGRFVDRYRSLDEFDDWSIRGAGICRAHPDYFGPLIAEIQTYRGCVRYCSGGCSFCIEPLFGDVMFRNPDSIIAEAKALGEAGVRNLRIGGQSCFVSYMAEGVGSSEVPRPSPGMIEYLLRGVKENARPEVLHLDNANPAVIAAHPEESARIFESIVEHCTSGNVLALGLESADPEVRMLNNLNATPEETITAIEIMNRIGARIGPTGLPFLLPGLNFLFGLRGETPRTYEHNREFLKEIMKRGLLLRRINIRQVIASRPGFKPQKPDRLRFLSFKDWVRKEIDRPILERMLPPGTILRNVYLELREGNVTFGRQVGSYPLLVGIPYKCELRRFVDVMITSHGYRSVTGVQYPLDINTAPMAALSALPRIGEKRARRIVLARPIKDLKHLQEVLADEDAARSVARYAGWV
jgi:radical SAM superfamily enzyme with C-terminal helix-hairpin-helix motif